MSRSAALLTQHLRFRSSLHSVIVNSKTASYNLLIRPFINPRQIPFNNSRSPQSFPFYSLATPISPLHDPRLKNYYRYRSMSDFTGPSALSDQVGAENSVKPLPAVSDDFGGVIVDMVEPMDGTVFLDALRASMSQWKHEGKKGIWLKLPIRLANLVEIAVKEGFWYHHAEPNYLMLVHWIPESVCSIPINASHRVGVGAIVLTEKRELLVVQEKSGRLRGTGVWKIPTGVVDEGEDICVAAVREVKEETGVDSEFVEVVAFRQTHKAFFDKSDLFFLCFLRPLSFDIQKQELEIEAAQWMPLDAFAAQPLAQKLSIFKSIAALCLAKLDKNYAGFSPEKDENPPYMYLNTGDLHRSGPALTNRL